jgi:hypothetical protein
MMIDYIANDIVVDGENQQQLHIYLTLKCAAFYNSQGADIEAKLLLNKAEQVIIRLCTLLKLLTTNSFCASIVMK